MEANEMKILRKIVGKTKIDRIWSQLIRESYDIQPINEWVERRRREWKENVIRMDAEILVKISRDNLPAGRRSPGLSSHWLKQVETPITKKKKKKEC